MWKGAGSFYDRRIKRALDLLLCVPLAAVALIPMLAVAAAIALTDGFPVLYRQERIGRYGKPFQIYKFRTMVKNADRIGPRSTVVGDPRVTPVGRFLRAASLDELPQFLNILRGDMSFVGYRPGVAENYTEDDYKSPIFDVRPGITGYAQVNGRSSLTMTEKRAWEARYTRDISFRTDVGILWKTVRVVFSRNSAY